MMQRVSKERCVEREGAARRNSTVSATVLIYQQPGSHVAVCDGQRPQ